MFVTGKLTALPQYGYYSITVLSGAELALAESAVWNYPVTNSGTISGGVFQGELENRGTVSGGTLQGTVENTPVGHIRGGTFLSNLTNSGYIHDGTFQGNVTNAYNGFIEGGTFSCFQLINEFRISGGTFRCMVTNNSVIEGGTFPNAVINSALGTIDGGEFSFYIQNNGTVAKAKLLGSLMGNDPQAVIHSVNGLDTPLGYGKDLLSELGAAPAGTAWYAGDTYISGGAVPLVYT